jgi:hypothetical protein
MKKLIVLLVIAATAVFTINSVSASAAKPLVNRNAQIEAELAKAQ